MTAFQAIDPSQLPPPSVVETLSVEEILQAMLADFRERLPAFTVVLESDPVYKLLEVAAYREFWLRARINDSSRAVMLAYARDTDLDHLAVGYGLRREVIEPADDTVVPPLPALLEDDERFRSRIQLSLEGRTTAGPEGAYRYHAFAADSRVKDIDVVSPAPGEVLVTVLSKEGEGLASENLLQNVRDQLSAETVRPLTDKVTVQGARIRSYVIEATLVILSGPDPDIVRDAAIDSLNDYVAEQHRLCNPVTLSGLYAALYREGIQNVLLHSPTEDIDIARDEAPWNDSMTVNTTVIKKVLS